MLLTMSQPDKMITLLSGICTTKYAPDFKDEVTRLSRNSQESKALDIASQLSTYPDRTKGEWQAFMAQSLSKNDKNPADVLDQAASILLMMNITSRAKRGSQNEWRQFEGRRITNRIPWAKNKTLAQSVRCYFGLDDHNDKFQLPFKQVSNEIRFGKKFNAYWLEKLGNFKIVPTENLLDHLTVHGKDVHIFLQPTFLRHVREAHDNNTGDETPVPLLPLELVEETLSTLSLLIPFVDRNCYAWLHRRREEQALLDVAVEELDLASRYVHEYPIWKDRLLELQREFAECEPGTLAQWWKYDRKRAQWWTFWTAVMVLCLTVFFGLGQLVTGIMQVYYSSRSSK